MDPAHYFNTLIQNSKQKMRAPMGLFALQEPSKLSYSIQPDQTAHINRCTHAFEAAVQHLEKELIRST